MQRRDKNMLKSSVLVILFTLSKIHGQAVSDCRVPVHCRRRPGGRLESLWTDLQGDVIVPPSFPPVVPPVSPINVGTGSLDDVLGGEGLSDSEKVQRLSARLQLLSVPGWFLGSNGYQYYVSNPGVAVPYSLAKLICECQGARIATVGMREDEARKNIVDNILRRCGNVHAFWIGYRDVVEEGTFVWDDGVSGEGFTTDWAQHQPDNTDGADCAITVRDRNYQWDDAPCESSNNGILCERFVGTA